MKSSCIKTSFPDERRFIKIFKGIKAFFHNKIRLNEEAIPLCNMDFIMLPPSSEFTNRKSDNRILGIDYILENRNGSRHAALSVLPKFGKITTSHFDSLHHTKEDLRVFGSIGRFVVKDHHGIYAFVWGHTEEIADRYY